MKRGWPERFLARVVGDAQAAAEIEMADGVPLGAQAVASASTLSTASRIGLGSRICEPMWQLTPSAAGCGTGRARS